MCFEGGFFCTLQAAISLQFYLCFFFSSPPLSQQDSVGISITYSLVFLRKWGTYLLQICHMNNASADTETEIYISSSQVQCDT